MIFLKKKLKQKTIVDYIGTNPPGAESLAATLLVGNTTGATKIEVDNTGNISGNEIIADINGKFKLVSF